MNETCLKKSICAQSGQKDEALTSAALLCSALLCSSLSVSDVFFLGFQDSRAVSSALFVSSSAKEKPTI
jgi:hypothetical protein